MDYELRIVVEKVAISSQEVIKRDPITSYAVQCPTSIGELDLRYIEHIDLLRKVQDILLAAQSLLLNSGMPVCPSCGNMLKKNGYKTSNFHAIFSDHTVRIQKHHCSHPDCRWHSMPTITSLFGTNIHPDLATLISKYLSGLCELDDVYVLKAGFETHLERSGGNRSPNQPLDDRGICGVKGVQIGVRFPCFTQ